MLALRSTVLQKFTQTVGSNAMHARPDLRVVLELRITGSGSVIADVMRLVLPNELVTWQIAHT